MALGRKNPKYEEPVDKTVEISAQMQGSLKFSDPVNLKINGQFSGSLDTKGTLTVGSSANVEADISGENIVIAGKVVGNINAATMLVLMPTASLKGNITTPKLNIVEGAIFQGNCHMDMGHAGTDSSEKFLDLSEVSKYLEIDLKEIEALANSGRIPATKAGNGWKFQRSKIDTWAATGRVD